MNLITSQWIPAIRADGSRELISPAQIAEQTNPVVELVAARPDFQGALYQFLIGLLQTSFAPDTLDDWEERWDEPPETAELAAAFNRLAPAFELDNPQGPAFMQDYDLPDADQKPISGLLIDAPGDNTQKQNLDHFIKRGQADGLCPACAATAVFTLQINAPSGGQGHRVGIRGGGPLTTLMVPEDPNASLWHKVWLNVLDAENGAPLTDEPLDARVMAWLAPTRVSDKSGVTTFPEDMHGLHNYWSMPRRIRLSPPAQTGCCDLCGAQDQPLYSHYRTRNYGIDYQGPWLHPLTPYRIDAKKPQEAPLSLKGQPGGLSYPQWLGLVLQDSENGDQAAAVVQNFRRIKAPQLMQRGLARLWCFGFDMDNMKARCWYEHSMPLLNIPAQHQAELSFILQELVTLARDTARLLRSQIKEALFRRPKDAKGDMSSVLTDFYQHTQADFYRLLAELVEHLAAATHEPPRDVYHQWSGLMLSQALAQFDRWVLSAPIEEMDMKRVTRARQGLRKKLQGSKLFKALRSKSRSDETTPNLTEEAL